MTFGRSGRFPENRDVALWFIAKRPGMTEVELAQAMFGVADQQRVNQDVRLLEASGFIRFQDGEPPRRLYANVTK